MSDIKPVDLLKLKEQAQSLTGWFNTTDAWLDTSEDSACAVVGHISDEGALYPVAVVDCDQYDAPSESMKLAKFYASANPKAILELIAAYEALQKENAELRQNLESEKLANTRLAELIKENNAKMAAGVYTTNEQYAKEVKDHDDLLTALEALEAKYEGALDSIRQYKQILKGVPEGAFEGGWTARGIMKHAADLERDNAVQAKRIAELESELVEWNEFKKIRDMQMQALRKQMS